MHIARHFLLLILILIISVSVIAQETPGDAPEVAPKKAMQQQEEAKKPGGYKNGLKSLFFGPRIGLEANEGIPVSFVEKANLFVPLSPFQAYGATGYKGTLTSMFMGPRVGMQLKERKIRKKEWFGFGIVLATGINIAFMSKGSSTTGIMTKVAVGAFFSRLWPAFEAWRGKTMTQVDAQEKLRKQ